MITPAARSARGWGWGRGDGQAGDARATPPPPPPAPGARPLSKDGTLAHNVGYVHLLTCV
jgi:hypothetical protein